MAVRFVPANLWHTDPSLTMTASGIQQMQNASREYIDGYVRDAAEQMRKHLDDQIMKDLMRGMNVYGYHIVKPRLGALD